MAYRTSYTMRNFAKNIERLRISNNDVGFQRGKILYKHENGYNRSGTFQNGEVISGYMYVPRALVSEKISISFYDEALNCSYLTVDAKLIDTVGNDEIYSFSILPNTLEKGLYFIEISIRSYGKNYYAYNECCELIFSEEYRSANIQVSVSDFKYSKPDIYGGIIYHIFVDRFFGSEQNRRKNKHFLKWSDKIPEYQSYPGEPIKNEYFYGGNLDGITEKLKYLSDLGITTIYLSPIFEAVSNHKYDTADYMKVDEGFGGDKSLELLIKKAENLGIGIILDGVFNHTGSNSLYFNKDGKYGSGGAYNTKNSEYYSWYNFYKYPTDYECWWGIKILPRINTDRPECADYFTGKNGVIQKYARMGIKGFRLDVADELSDEFITKIKKSLDEINDRTVLYGEVWEDASSKIAYSKRKEYYLGSELDGVMNYPLREGIISFLRDRKHEKLRYALTDVTMNAPKRVRDAQMNLLGSHDTERILTALGGKKAEGLSNEILSDTKMSRDEYERAVKRLKAAYTVVATLPGIPEIYYGDEAGMEGYKDPFNRQTFPWENIDEELHSHYKKIGRIRRENEIYKEGEYRLLYLSIDILLFVRYNNKGSVYYTLLNNRKEDIKLSFSAPSKSLTRDMYFNSLRVGAIEAEIFKAERDTTLYLSF